MDRNTINISNIEAYMSETLGGVSDNVFVGTLPDTLCSEWQDMCLVDCSDAINDMDAYGKGVVRVYLYARPKTNGGKNLGVLCKLEQALNECLRCASDKHYMVNRRTTYTDYDNRIKWHCNIVELNLMCV